MRVETVILLAALGFAAWGCVLAWRWKSARDFAPQVYAAKRKDGELADHVSETDFVVSYMRAEAPRAPLYFFTTALLTAISIPPLMGVFSWVWHQIWLVAGQYEPVATGRMVHTFGLFVFSMLVMIGLLAFAMRRYYVTAPPDLRNAIKHLNEKADAA